MAGMRYQPQNGQRIDLSHPLARGIQAAFVPGANGFLQDAITGNAFDTSSGSFTTAPNRAGRGVKNSARNSQSAPDPKNKYGNASYSYVLVLDVPDPGGTYAGLYCRTVGGTTSSSSLQNSPAGAGKFDVYHGDNPVFTTTAGTGFVSYLLNGLCVMAVCYDDSDRSIRFYLNGALIESGTCSASPTLGAGRLVLFGERGETGTYGMQGACSAFFPYNRALSDADAKKITSSLVSPFQIFRAPDEEDFVAAAGAAALAGAASGVATGAGSLTTAIKLAGAASASASSTAALTTSIALTGAASATGTASGALGTAIKLVGQAAASASSSGALITGIPLAGSAAASATASAPLTTQGAGLAGQATTTAAAAGALTTAIPLAGTAAAASVAAGSIGTAIVLSGLATASAATSASLTTTPAGLAGTASAMTSASGVLLTGISLTGNAAVAATGIAALTAPGAGLGGSAVARSTATAALATSINLSGAASCGASATGAFASLSAMLGGVASVSSAAQGALSTGIALKSSAGAAVLSLGQLTTAIRMAGSAGATTSATGALADVSRVPVVAISSRTYVGSPRIRQYSSHTHTRQL